MCQHNLLRLSVLCEHIILWHFVIVNPFSAVFRNFVDISQKHGVKIMNLFERIEALCKDHGINITEMCRQTGLTRAKLSDLKMGRTKSLSANTLSTIAGFFGVSVDYLLGNEGKAEHVTTEHDIKVALFGGASEVTDEMWAEVKSFVEFVKQKNGIN